MAKFNLFLLLFYTIFGIQFKNSNGNRNKRTLIFPPTSPTRVQFIYGIGIPLEELDLESLTTGYVLKAEYFLPTTAKELRPTQLTPQDIGYIVNSKRDISYYDPYNITLLGDTTNSENHQNSKRPALSKYRWAVYETFKVLLKRFLIFPPSVPTRYQFIAGLGIPAELPDYESVITGYVLKAMYYLPSNASQLYVLNPYGNKISGNMNSNTSDNANNQFEIVRRNMIEKRNIKPFFPELRWVLYSFFNGLLKRAGFDGEACLLRSICEIGAIPFHRNGGLMAELIHIILSPSTSHDVIEKHKNYQFLKAEKLGKQGAACNILFKECKISIMEKFTLVKDLFEMWG